MLKFDAQLVRQMHESPKRLAQPPLYWIAIFQSGSFPLSSYPVLLSVDNLHVAYGAIKALHGISVHIDRGEIVSLIGANGAGKTTLLRTISGLLHPTTGEIRWNDNNDSGDKKDITADLRYASPSRKPADLASLPPHEIVRLGISHVPEGRQIFADLSVRENLLLGGYQQTSRPQLQVDLDRCYTLFPVLAERTTQRGGTLSGGEQQMLAIGRALMARPKLLLLDEPSLGLAPLVVRKIFQIIREINATGTTVFLVEQNAHMALAIAHRGYVLQSGEVLLTDTAQNLLHHPDVRKAYLGG
jgi:branched-chain amino acid transport system ATP-binding protein